MRVIANIVFLIENFILLIDTFIALIDLPSPVALYPLNKHFNTSDTSCHANPPGLPVGSHPAISDPGGPGHSSYEFAGKRHSYIQILPSIAMGSPRSITILGWIFHTGFSGPIVSYISGELGFGLWTTLPDTLTAKLSQHSDSPVSSNKVNLDSSWHYVGVSYDYPSGVLALWIDSVRVKETVVGKIQLATKGSLCMGACQGDEHYFKGRISCLQIYSKALSEDEVAVVKKRCSSEKTSKSTGLWSAPHNRIEWSRIFYFPQYPFSIKQQRTIKKLAEWGKYRENQ